jgi:cytochrome c peroxidase
MHNGMLPTLRDVLRFYDAGRSENPNVSNQQDQDRGRGRDRRRDDNGIARVSGQFRRVDSMSDGEMEDIIAFLNALTDANFDRTVPARVPSGLPPGGLMR